MTQLETPHVRHLHDPLEVPHVIPGRRFTAGRFFTRKRGSPCEEDDSIRARVR